MNLKRKVQVNVGSLADMGKRFASAWEQAEAGEVNSQINQTQSPF